MSDVYLGKSKIEGQGVLASRFFQPREVIMEYKGDIVHAADIPKKDFYGIGDRYVQVGEDQFLGPSGELDDYLNHSCDPTAGLVNKDNKVFVIAIKHIAKDEEVAWDYSTTLALNGAWEMPCHCGAENCRGVIRDFKTLPEETKIKYRDLGIVPSYILDDLKNEPKIR